MTLDKLSSEKSRTIDKEEAYITKDAQVDNDFGERVITDGDDIRAIARSGWSGRFRISGSTIAGMPTDNVNYSQGLIVSNTSSSDTYMIELVYYKTGELYTCGGNKSGSAESPWLKHRGDKGVPDGVQTVNNIKPDETGNVVIAIPEVPEQIVQTVNGHGPDVSGNVVVSGTGAHIVDAAELGLVYGVKTQAAANASKLRTLLAAGVIRMSLSDDIYFDFTAGYGVIVHGLEIYGTKGNKIFWGNTSKGFMVENEVVLPFLKFVDCHHVHDALVTSARLDILTMDSGADVSSANNGKWGGMSELVSLNCTYEGNIRFDYLSWEDDAENPTKGRGGYSGIKLIHFENTVVLNNMSGSSTISANMRGFRMCILKNTYLRNCTNGFYWGAVANKARLYETIKFNMRHLHIDGLTWENDENFIIDKDGGYVTAASFEGNRWIVENVLMKHIVISAKYKTSFYSFYYAGITAEVRNHDVVDCYNFHPEVDNTCFKLKKTWNANINSCNRRYSEGFFHRMKDNHNLDVENTQGSFISIDLEPGPPFQDTPSYGSRPSEDIVIRNCKCFCPKLLRSQELSKSPQKLSSFELYDNDFESLDTGACIFLAAWWADWTGVKGTNGRHDAFAPENQSPSKRCIAKRNRIYIPNGRTVFTTVAMEDMRTPTERGGSYIIDLHDNDITARHLRELMLTTNSSGSARTNLIDVIRVTNNVTIIPTTTSFPNSHQLFTEGNSVCAVNELYFGGRHRGDKELTGFRLDQGMSGALVTEGNLEIVFTGLKNKVVVDEEGKEKINNANLVLADFANPLRSSGVHAKTWSISGTMESKEGIFEFRTGLTISNPTTTGFTYTFKARETEDEITKTWQYGVSYYDDSFVHVDMVDKFNPKAVHVMRLKLSANKGNFKVRLYPQYSNKVWESPVILKLDIMQI